MYSGYSDYVCQLLVNSALGFYRPPLAVARIRITTLGRARDAAIVRWVYFVHRSCDRLALRLAIVSLWVQQLYILAVYCGYSDYAFYLCTVRTVIMYSSCVMWAHLL